ncbi:DEAD/DEAH box helicase [Pseudomonas syringae]|uniref:Helicase, C-terminal:DEAD/DEAH box helicase, N-terminal n=1 Tax=Pseudomonas syringae pv. syringae (strain B728a) TaxID=205918 RepID=Q4ZL30_PSEU2|nr:DEAD/DEAH box helicase [Pseudomonas syringae]AAY40142.1 Helicase, C-terminal:DEAD/DEAH box helicase, N-terminal [Pseudomonas syringae pv. syringae B728a]PYD15001.1 helicase [Pseudomonas syringae pv. syringae]
MAEFDEQRLDLAEQVRLGLANESRLLPEHARAFVRGLQMTWRVPPIAWDEGETEKLVQDAHRLIQAAEVCLDLEGPNSVSAKDCFRRAAELLEWLTRMQEEPSSFAPVGLLAAAAFQLGGLPAMATALLGQLEITDDGTRLLSKFLSGDFNGVVEEILAFWGSYPELTKRDSSTQLLASSEAGGLEWYFVVELVRSIGVIASSLMCGENERMQQGLRKLKALDKMATRTYGDELSMLISLLTVVAEGYGSTSIYGPILQLVEIKPEREARLRRFARDQFGRGRGILWPSQLRGLERLLKSSSFALCTPTGSGKTLVANLALIKELMLAPSEKSGPLALYLVPSRALAGEVEAKLLSELGSDLVVTGLYGGSDWGITDYWLNAEKPTVLIATVEKADALMRYVGPLIVARLQLLIIDEAHQVVVADRDRAEVDFAEHSSRTLRLENFVSRLLARAPHIARVALTAVAGGAATPVACWVEGGSQAEPIGANYRSTRQLIGTLTATPDEPGQMRIDLLNGAGLHVRGRARPVYIPLRILPMPKPPAAIRNSLARYNQIHVLWTALHLVDGDRRVLISIAQQPEQTMKWFKDALDLPQWSDASKFTPPNEPANQALFEKARASCIDYCGKNSYEVALLDRGIATSHGQMPQRLRRLMTSLIDRRICPITVATATLTEGVNLPFDLILVPSITRQFYDAVSEKSKVTPFSAAEFRNLAGRAGRPGNAQGPEGITLVAIPTQPSTTAPRQIASQTKQLGQLRTHYSGLLSSLREDELEGGKVLSPLSLLLEAIREKARTLFNVDGEQFLSWLEETAPDEISANAGLVEVDDESRLADSLDELDGVLLTAIEELSLTGEQADSAAKVEALLRKVWQFTFSKVVNAEEAWLERAFVRRGQGVVGTLYNDRDERRRLYQYGFTPYVGRRFERIVPKIRSVLEDSQGYGLANQKQRLEVFKRLGLLISNDPGFGFRARASVTDQGLHENWEPLLAWWMSLPGAKAPSAQDLRSWQRFVTENLEFRLGVAIGAVVAQAWTEGANDPTSVPSLEAWRQTTGLPWFGFWAREMLRWGTLDPFVAFALAQGLAGTRDEAKVLRESFESWMDLSYMEIEIEDWIDPQYFVEWQRTLHEDTETSSSLQQIKTRLTGTDGARGSYRVLPLMSRRGVRWLDASGFELARSEMIEEMGEISYRDDFELRISQGKSFVRRIFRSS